MPTVLKIDESYFFITGNQTIFALNHNRSSNNDPLAQLLTPEDIELLPIEVVYTGRTDAEFSTQENEAMRIILKIIELMNLMQSDEWYSYPLGKYHQMFNSSKECNVIMYILAISPY